MKLTYKAIVVANAKQTALIYTAANTMTNIYLPYPPVNGEIVWFWDQFRVFMQDSHALMRGDLDLLPLPTANK